ncbi:MAG: hypothetical protein J0H83_05860 [Candidatus Melainabacteria bacterium]|nr:hypothetical protein [Candidatus Melainabacteria bacterium]
MPIRGLLFMLLFYLTCGTFLFYWCFHQMRQLGILKTSRVKCMLATIVAPVAVALIAGEIDRRSVEAGKAMKARPKLMAVLMAAGLITAFSCKHWPGLEMAHLLIYQFAFYLVAWVLWRLQSRINGLNRLMVPECKDLQPYTGNQKLLMWSLYIPMASAVLYINILAIDLLLIR